MNVHRPLGPLASIGRGFALGSISALCGSLMLNLPALEAVAVPLTGVIFGLAVFLGCQTALGWPERAPARAVIVVLACLLAWLLARRALAVSGPFYWVIASLAGALGVAGGVLLAWPRHVHRTRLLIALTAAGIAGGVMFTQAYELAFRVHLDSTLKELLPLLLMCLWQGAVVTASTLALRSGYDR